ncbi:MAG: hypothetical protein OQK12_18555 [Motiliproteus sp.]|nr:hypothetical protein [Motiliproteus sp.]MCW9053377.1 hypothetical protein [Motiliproteus sp.]
MKNDELCLLFETAAHYICDEDYRQKFNAAVKIRKQALSPDGKDWPVKTCPSKITLSDHQKNAFRSSDREPKDDLARLILLTSVSAKNWVTPKRHHQGQKTTSEELITHCDTPQLAAYLGIPTSCVGKLMRSGLIAPLRPMKTTRDTLFNITEIDLNVECSVLGANNNTMSFKEIVQQERLSLFHQPLEALYLAAKKGLQPYAKKASALITEASFERDEFDAFFERQFWKSTKDLTLKEASKVLAVSKITIEQLILDEHLTVSERSAKRTQISKLSLKSLMKNYQSLNRIAKIECLHRTNLSKELAVKGILPIHKYGHDYFYEARYRNNIENLSLQENLQETAGFSVLHCYE